MDPPRRPFHLNRLRLQAWRIRKLPPDQRQQAGKALLSEIKNYLNRLSDDANLPRSDVR